MLLIYSISGSLLLAYIIENLLNPCKFYSRWAELAHEQVWMSEEGELGIKYIEAVNCIVIVGFMRKTCSS